MSIYIYRSTDTSAPQLSGTVGSMINVLDACLVNGYPNGVKAAMGQTKPLSGTNLAVYQMPAGTSQTYLAIDDTGVQATRLRGFTSITSPQASSMPISTLSPPIGLHAFPNEFQLAGGTQFQKSQTASATARPWVIISNGKIIYFYCDCNSDAGVAAGRTWVFGDISSYVPFDTNPCILIGSHTDSNNYFMTLNIGANIASHYLCQKFDGNGYSIPFGKAPTNGAHANNATTVMGQASTFLQYPDPITGSLQLSPIVVMENVGGSWILRGRMPGLWSPIHPNTTMATGDTVSGVVAGSLANRTFEGFRAGNYGVPLMGLYLMETSDTWHLVNFR